PSAPRVARTSPRPSTTVKRKARTSPAMSAAVSSLRASPISPPSLQSAHSASGRRFHLGTCEGWRRCNCRSARSCIGVIAARAFPANSHGMLLGLPRGMATGAARAVERAADKAETPTDDKYEILGELGASPVGTTYKVRHAVLDSV